MSRLRGAIAMAAMVAVGLFPSIGTASPKIETSDNVKPVKQFLYEGGTELATMGDIVISGELNGSTDRGQDPEKGGMHIFSIAGKTPKEVGFLHCPGTDNDVEFIRPGLAAMAFSSNMCVPQAGTGVMLVDISKPSKPRIVSALNTARAHTFKPFPGGKYVYMAGGNLTGSATRGTVIVDVTNPMKPKLAARADNVMDCHDLSFSIEGERKLGFCSGAVGTGEVQIWDVSDPLAPEVIGRIVNPLIQYSHYAIANQDGTILAIDDEAFAAHDCNTGMSPTGRVWFYDISTPEAPVVQGSMAAPARGANGTGGTGIGTYPGWTTSWCLSHGLDWHPKTNNLAVTWFTGGWSVLNADNPLTPTEVAWGRAEDSTTYSTLWAGDLLWTNDMLRGAEAFSVKGVSK
jgi:hypothetical protein